ncbi:MAG TPA: exosortase/archaeosortase family protein [Acidobacteriota bacterium]|nr:exosortase/archaeosortase family protein [Acidobacteriota bacterium]
MSEVTAVQSRYSPWLRTAPFLLLAAAYLPVLYDLVTEWYQDANYSHGFLVPVVSGYLLWKNRHRLGSTGTSPAAGGLVLLVAGLLLLLVGTGAAEYFTVRVSFILSLFGLVYCLYGREVIRKSWFAFFFLLFMVPIPYVLYYAVAFPMQTLATKITVVLLKVVGLGVVRQGNIIHLAGNSLEVADACSGIRSLVSLLALGALYAYLTQRRLAAKAIVFVSTVPIAVAANVFRVFVTALLVSAISIEVTAEPLHSLLGLSVFVFSFICLFVAGAVVRRVFK